MAGKIARILTIVSVLLTGVVFILPAPAACLEKIDVPPALKDWKGWVLYGLEDRLCPTSYKDGQAYHCLWPSRLKLSLETKGGRFSQRWLVFTQGWVPLPGGPGAWPKEVKLNGASVPVLGQNGAPFVRLKPGQALIEGLFEWGEMPETIQVPAASGLVSLNINGRLVDFPVLDRSGRLWLQRRVEAAGQEDRLEIRIYRLLSDTIPMMVTNHLKISVSGRAREIKLDRVLLDQAIPMSLKSLLPARIGPRGELNIQARPGRWDIQVVTRFKGPVYDLGPVKGEYGREIWAFRSRNHLRMVKITGVPSVDAGQTDAPLQWKGYPAYIVEPGSKIHFKELRRGDPDPAPDRLTLLRTWWLDFDGAGFSVQDKISGIMSRRWRLAMNRPGILGRVSVDGADQLITVQNQDQKPGVELRRGKINIVADSRFEESTSRAPAVGWDHDFESVSGVLNMPPGWRLLTAAGVDVLPGTWFQGWSLLDFFLVLIIALAVFKLRGWPWGILALVTMTLIYHEPSSPRLVWLHLLAALALLRVLPLGWVRRLINLYRVGAVVTLLVIAIPFMVSQVRWGIYPQLERTGVFISYPMGAYPDAEIEDSKAVKSIRKKKPRRPYASSQQAQVAAPSFRKQAVLTQDPNALIQTGPGLPTWKWRSVSMKWNGPVDRNQEIRLWLLSPRVNLGLSLLRVVLLALMILGLMDLRRWWRGMDKRLGPAAAIIALLLLPGLASAGTIPTKKDHPGPQLLEELKKRLLEKPDCLPWCADCPRMELSVTPGALHILL
ncbi:MAG: hypothetical protein SV487_02900, partial [Thermodesulfobacteriota bacterium]|nr:hypothetical protein [Thermodesulfobacteriota bacterium]